MNKLRILFTQLLTLLLLLVSNGCSDKFLEVLPIDAITADNYYRNEAQMNRALNAAYSAVGNRGMFGWWQGVLRNVRSDNGETVQAELVVHQGFVVNDTDIRLFNRNNGDGLWNSLFFGILRCNLIIVNIPNADIPNQEVRNRILGQALFLRALYNFYVVDYWNQGPLMLEDNFNQTDVALSDASRFWAAIEADLRRVVDGNMLPWTYDGSPGLEIGRASMGSALSLLGKVYLFQGKFTDAANAFSRVINQGVYSLIPLEQVWTVQGENGPESVFEVQFNNSRAASNPFFDDGVQAAEITLRNQTIAPNQYNGWENVFPTRDLVEAFTPGDRRRAAFIVLPGEMFPGQAEPFRGIARNRGEYAVKKGMGSGFSTGTPGGTGEENFPIIRYADVLLMHAEALIRGGGSATQAADLIDQVRVRAFGATNVAQLRAAGNGIQQFATQRGISLFEALKIERRLELCFEGHRYSDLMRWGDAANNRILRDRGWNPGAAYYPLSREDIDLSTQFGR